MVGGGVSKNDVVEDMGMEPEVDDEDSPQRLFIVWVQVRCGFFCVTNVSPSRTPSGARRVSPSHWTAHKLLQM